MKIGVFTPLFNALPLEPMLDKVASFGVEAIELGTGNYPGNAHCDPDGVLGDDGARQKFVDAVAARGLTISALSCHGNPLHPDPAQAAVYHETWRKTARLAVELGVPVVNLFSGCPGEGPGARQPNWVTCSWPPEFREVLEWQWNEAAIPYWAEEAAFARSVGLEKIALEMHGGFLVYNPEGVLRMRDAAGPEIGTNLDPSHLFWQGIDPLEAVRELGAAGAVFHVHAKDTNMAWHNVRRNGVLDTKLHTQLADRSWVNRSVGYGHDELFWREFVSALRLVGYDHVLSIEHEDPLASIDEGLTKAVEVLQRVVLHELPGRPWWM